MEIFTTRTRYGEKLVKAGTEESESVPKAVLLISLWGQGKKGFLLALALTSG